MPRIAAPRVGGLDPFRLVWALFCNVKFALVLVGTAATAGLVGTVLPQVPAPMRANAAARSAWIELRREDFGAFTGTMNRFELFDVFHSAWFNGLWIVIIAAVTVCTVSRFVPTWRSVQHPQKVVGDAYFERAHHRASFSHAGGAGAVEQILRCRRYRVERVDGRGEAAYLFAERYAWSQYGTFLSHLALLMLLVGGLLTVFVGFDKTLVIAEATPAARVFDEAGFGQIFIRMLDAHRGIDESGNLVDYHSMIEVRRGDETKVCKTSVNDPCRAFGYKIHQAAFFDDLARLRVVGPGGIVLFDSVLDFESRTTAVPRIEVFAADGRQLFAGDVPQAGLDPGPTDGREDDVAIGIFEFPAPERNGPSGVVYYSAAWRVVEGELRVIVTGASLRPTPLTEVGAEASTTSGLTIRYAGPSAIPAIRVEDMPGSVPGEPVFIQMPTDAAGTPFIVVSGLQDTRDEGYLALHGADPQTTSAGYTYTFGGRVEASGVSVKRDPGDTFIWLAVGMAVIGLAITFYVPRRRLWVRIAGDRTSFAGVAERTTRFGRELRFMGAELGAKDALLPGDLSDD
jgi:cytochrome c biogenesis protein